MTAKSGGAGMAADKRHRRGRLSRRLVACVVLPALIAFAMAWTAWEGFSRTRTAALAAAEDGVAALAPALRMMQGAEGLGAAVGRLLWAENHQSRAEARAAADLHWGTVADYLAAGPAFAQSATGRQIGDGLERFAALNDAANRSAERRLEAVAALPSARERLIVVLAGLDALLTERRAHLNALQRFHPDTQLELERHEEWRRVSKNLLSALLLSANFGDGQSGAASAAAAHLARLNQVVAAFPDSEFAVAARRQQDDVAAAVNGPTGALTRLAGLRETQAAAALSAVDIRRAALELAQAGATHVEAERRDLEARLRDIAADADNRQQQIAVAALAAAAAAALGIAYVRRSVGARLRRLLTALDDGRSPAQSVGGDDEIAAAAVGLQRAQDAVAVREAAVAEAGVRLEIAVDAADAAIWDVNLIDGRVWWSPGYYRLLGYEPGEIAPATGAWEMLVHPDDRAAAAEAAERCVAGMAERFTSTYRVRRKDETWIWVEDHGGVRRDHDGLPARFVGLMRDVSNRRRAEIRMRRDKETAEAAARAGGELLTAAERRLRPGLRRLAGKLNQLESWALTDEQRRLVAEVKRDSAEVLAALAMLKRGDGGDESEG
jgi:PAS domain S-box-containing protein